MIVQEYLSLLLRVQRDKGTEAQSNSPLEKGVIGATKRISDKDFENLHRERSETVPYFERYNHITTFEHL